VRSRRHCAVTVRPKRCASRPPAHAPAASQDAAPHWETLVNHSSGLSRSVRESYTKTSRSQRQTGDTAVYVAGSGPDAAKTPSPAVAA